MSWITPVDRRHHPCLKPQASNENMGKLWRCEICDDLWRVTCSWTQPTWEQAGPWLRWLYRGQGYADGHDATRPESLLFRQGLHIRSRFARVAIASAPVLVGLVTMVIVGWALFYQP